MKIPQNIFNDLFLKSHNPLATQSIKTLYNVDKFMFDENRNLYPIVSYNYKNITLENIYIKMIIINTIDVDFKEYTKSNFIMKQSLKSSGTIRFYVGDVEIDIIKGSFIVNQLIGDIITLHVFRVATIKNNQ